MAESTIVARNRVTIGEQRVDRTETNEKVETMSVHSKDRYTVSMKLDRIGDLSAGNHDLVFNNLGHLINEEMLMRAFAQLDGTKAVGIDGITKEAYGKNLEENLRMLAAKVHRAQYAPQPSKIVEIPKADGGKRPLAISCIEDKLVQMAAGEILNKIYEPLFLPSSFGYRPGKSCHDAITALHQAVYECKDGALLEIDIRKYFNSIPHMEMEAILQKKINDPKFLRLIHILLQAETITNDGVVQKNLVGCPQGSVTSPILSNIYLHEVVDSWIESIRTYLKGKIFPIRFCDDMVFVFECSEDAERFYRAFTQRLQKYGLAVHEDKSHLHSSGSKRIAEMAAKKQKLPVFKFLGFTFFWEKAQKGNFWRLKVRSRGDRKHSKLQGLSKFLKENKAMKTLIMFQQILPIIKGWINYHAVTDNSRA